MKHGVIIQTLIPCSSKKMQIVLQSCCVRAARIIHRTLTWPKLVRKKWRMREKAGMPLVVCLQKRRNIRTKIVPHRAESTQTGTRSKLGQSHKRQIG